MNFRSSEDQPPEHGGPWPSSAGPAAAECPGLRIGEVNLTEFGELVSFYQDRLFHTVLRLVGNAEDARDVVQETFLRAYQFRETFHGESLFFTWLFRIAANTAISLKRKERRVRGFQPSGEEKTKTDPPDASLTSQPGHAAELAEQERKVHEALSKISGEHREVLVMKDMEEMKYEEMAEILGVPVGTIRSRLHRARLKLRQILTQE